MPLAKGTYKCPRYLIPLGLLEASSPYARERKMSIREYGRQAIRLLNFASEQGFSSKSTRLILPFGSTPLPSVTRRRPETTIRRPVQIQLPNEQAELMQQFARQAGISDSERATRAYRFANFIAEQVQPGDRLLFEHQGNGALIEATELLG